MKRKIAAAMTSILYVCSAIALAQQGQTPSSDVSGQQINQPGPAPSNQPDTSPSQSGPAASSGPAGTSGASGQSGSAGGASMPSTPTPGTTSGTTSGATGGTMGSASGGAPVAGRTALGVSAVEMETVILGWSAKKELLGKTVINDKNDKIGKIDDIIITPEKAASYGIIGAGGFLGVGKHDVAIPAAQLKMASGQLQLSGATKEALMSMPKFEYQKH